MNLIDKKNNSGLPVILLVDDNDDILFFLTTLLKNQYQIRTAYDGREACTILENQYIHLVVSDVMMPDMDGFDLCEWIKSRPNFAHIPVILLTAKDTLQSKIEGLKLGADVYIEKPFSTDHLQAQIQNLLHNRNLIKSFYAHSPLSHINPLDINKNNEQFFEEIQIMVLQHLDNIELDVNLLADLLHMSRPTLYRKIKSLLHLSPYEVIHLIRLNKAAELMVNSQLRINEVSERVGYSSQSQFARHFSKQFNMTPSEYKEKVKSSTPNLSIGTP